VFKGEEIFGEFDGRMWIGAILGCLAVLDVPVYVYCLVLVHHVFHMIYTGSNTPVIIQVITNPEIGLRDGDTTG
jgi:hypothetical protein